MNVPECYVIRTLPFMFSLFLTSMYGHVSNEYIKVIENKITWEDQLNMHCVSHVFIDMIFKSNNN